MGDDCASCQHKCCGGDEEAPKTPAPEGEATEAPAEAPETPAENPAEAPADGGEETPDVEKPADQA